MSTPSQPDENAGAPSNGGAPGAATDAETTSVRAESVPTGESTADPAGASSEKGGGSAGPPPPWARGGAAAGPGTPSPSGSPATGGPRGPAGQGPAGPGGGPGPGGQSASGPGGGAGGQGGPGRGPESGAIPVAGRTSPPSGPMPVSDRAGDSGPAGAASSTSGPASSTSAPGSTGEGSGGRSKSEQRSATALIDAPTNQLSPEQLGMRTRRDRSERTDDAGDADDELSDLASPRTSRGKVPRRASLQVKRFDPWSVLKLALVLGVALFFVWMFAVGVLYAVLDGMGVWAQLNGTYQDLTSDSGGGGGDLITAGGIFGVAAIIGVINTILFTALASVSAFIYNISADVAGGIEVTLSERD